MLPKWNLADIQERMFNRALMVTDEKARIALGVLGPRLNIGSLFVGQDGSARLPLSELKAQAQAAKAQMESLPGDDGLKKYAYDPATDSAVEKAPYEVWNGAAIFSIRGSLMAENGIDPYSGATGYDGLSFKTRHAVSDAAVKGAILDIDSGGGEVVDLIELCSELRSFAEQKPLRAIIRGQACSAAYALAACAGPGNITAAPYSVVGSIGAIMLHADFSKQLDDSGIDVTMITSAAHKADGNPYEPLAADVAARLKAMVDQCASDFIDHVSSARTVDRDLIAQQEARFYSGQAALDLGLVDKFIPWNDSMREFAEGLNGGGARSFLTAPVGARSARKENLMSNGTPTPAEQQPETYDEAAMATARSDARAEGVEEGAQGERQRISALAEIDRDSQISASLQSAIDEGTTPGDFAIAGAKAAKAKISSAAASAQAEAIKPDDLPATDALAGQPGVQAEANRGKAFMARKAAAGA